MYGASLGAIQLSPVQAAALNSCISSYCPSLPPELQPTCLSQCAAKAAAMPGGVPKTGGGGAAVPVTAMPAAAASMLPGPGLSDQNKKYLAFGVGALAAIGVVYWYSKKKKG